MSLITVLFLKNFQYLHKLSITGLILNLFTMIITIIICLDNSEKDILLYLAYCVLSGASIGLYGTTNYIILFNKCEGVLEIIGLSQILEFCILYFKLMKTNKSFILVYIGLAI